LPNSANKCECFVCVPSVRERCIPAPKEPGKPVQIFSKKFIENDRGFMLAKTPTTPSVHVNDFPLHPTPHFVCHQSHWHSLLRRDVRAGSA